MKNFKRISSVVLAIVMVFAMMVPAMAEGTGSITIKEASVGETYTAYKLFDVSYVGTAHSYTFVEDSAAKTAQKALLEGFEVDGEKLFTFTKSAGQSNTYVVTPKEGIEATDIAALAAFLQGKQDELGDEFPFEAKGYATNNREVEADITISDLELGYYFVDTTTGSLCSIDTTNDKAEVTDKNDDPTISKEVRDVTDADILPNFGETSDAEIGDEVEFKITVEAKHGAENYVVHDTLGEGFTFDFANATFTINDGTKDLVKDADYIVRAATETGAEEDPKCTFEIKFLETYLDTIDDDKTITITYTATVNDKAASENKNSVYLTWGNSQKTIADETTTKTYDLNIFKYYLTDPEDENSKEKLDGAKFELYYDADCTNKVNLVGNATDGYRVALDNETDIGAIIAGDVHVFGLDGNQIYYLKEIEAPTGYNLLSENVTVNMEQADKKAEVQNKSGVELPETGGIGTTIFYLVGGLMVTGAFVLLITKKRMGNRA